MIEKYLPYIKKINEEINNFNNYLKDEYNIPSINVDRIETRDFLTLIDKPWKELLWPNPDKAGVYFVFGFAVDNEIEKILYIGKASMNSKIGARLDRRFRYSREGDNYFVKKRGIRYQYEMATSIDIESSSSIFLVPALEEFLIDKMKNEILLLNVNGA